MPEGTVRPRVETEYRSRRRKAVLLALCLASCLAVAWSGQLSGPGTIEHASAASSAPKRFFGFTPDFGAVEDATLTAYYKRLRRGGARWVRFGIYWWYIERNRGHRTWYSTDRFFAATACARLAALPMFIGAPPWASGRSSTIAPPRPTYLPQYKDMIRRVIARYGIRGSYWKRRHRCPGGNGRVPVRPVHKWQVWNEPNVMSYYGGQRATAKGYGRLLTAADKAINTSANPRAKTVLGGLTGGQASDFLRTLYNEWPNLNARVNIFDVHAYASTPQNSLDLLREFRRTANAHGARSKPIWVTEVAWSSCLQNGQTYPARCRSNPLARNEAGQRVSLIRMYKRLINNARALKLQRVAWYSWKDPELSRGTCAFCYGTGLLRRNRSPKPAWNAYVRLAGGRR